MNSHNYFDIILHKLVAEGVLSHSDINILLRYKTGTPINEGISDLVAYPGQAMAGLSKFTQKNDNERLAKLAVKILTVNARQRFQKILTDNHLSPAEITKDYDNYVKLKGNPQNYQTVEAIKKRLARALKLFNATTADPLDTTSYNDDVEDPFPDVPYTATAVEEPTAPQPQETQPDATETFPGAQSAGERLGLSGQSQTGNVEELLNQGKVAEPDPKIWFEYNPWFITALNNDRNALKRGINAYKSAFSFLKKSKNPNIKWAVKDQANANEFAYDYFDGLDDEGGPDLVSYLYKLAKDKRENAYYISKVIQGMQSKHGMPTAKFKDPRMPKLRQPQVPELLPPRV